MTVPLMDIQAQYGPLRAEIDAAVAGVLDSGRFILGPEGRALEASVSERLGGRPCVGVANGTDALVIALNALDIGPGDEVITTPYTFYATAEAIARVGATPVFADIDPATYCLDPEAARAKIGPKTKAILPVHIFGHPADMTAITALAREHGLVVIEDSAQAFGARAAEGEIATFGDAATFSFFPTKNFPGMGDGGMVVCRDEELAERIRRLRFHGSKDKVVFDEVGYNSRLDDLQAAIIRVFYPHLDDWNARRAQAAGWYEELGLGAHATLPAVAPGATHIYHLYMVRHPRSRRPARGPLGRRRLLGRLLRHPDAPAARVRAARILRGRPPDRRGAGTHGARAADAPQPDPRRRRPGGRRGEPRRGALVTGSPGRPA